MSKRRGRKRKNQTSIHLITTKKTREKDLGTPELQKKRSALAKSGNPEDTTDALSLLCGRGHISEDQRRAGTIFTIAYYHTFGKPFARSGCYGDLLREYFPQTAASPELTDYDARMTELYKRADDDLRQAGRRIRDVTKNVAVFDRLPGWLTRDRLRSSDEEDRLCLLAGLDVLVLTIGIST